MNFRSNSQKNINNVSLMSSPEYQPSKFVNNSNCSNTLSKFFKPEIEYVAKLNFYNPDSVGNCTMYNLKKAHEIEKRKEETESRIKLNLKLPKLDKDSTSVDKIYTSSKFLNMGRLENMNLEITNETKRKRLEEKLKNSKTELKKLYSQMNLCKKEVENYQIDCEFLDNFYKYIGFEDKFKKTIRKSGAGLDNEEYQQLMTMKKILDIEEGKRNAEKRIKEREISKRNDTIHKIRELIEDYHNNLKETNTELNDIKNNLLVHYHTLLSEGKDTRKDGLVWIVTAIWNLGEKILPSYLPSFLDEKAISYLYNYAERDIELARIKKKLDEVHLKMRIKREKIALNEKINLNNNLVLNKLQNSTHDLGNTQLTFKTALESAKENYFYHADFEKTESEINKNIIKKLIEKYKREKNNYEENFSFKAIKEFMKNRGEIGEEVKAYISTVSELESQYKSLQNVMQIMKRNELDRINKEFYTNDYERRFKISQKAMISALIGEDNMATEFNRQKREQKQYYQKIENIRTFNILETTSKKLNSSVIYDVSNQ